MADAIRSGPQPGLQFITWRELVLVHAFLARFTRESTFTSPHPICAVDLNVEVFGFLV